MPKKKSDYSALDYGRIKRSIKSRVKKRLNPSESTAKFLVFLDEKDKEGIAIVLGALIDDIERGNVKIYWSGTEEGKKAMQLYGVKPPAILRKEGGGWKRATIVKNGDEVIVEF